jgi:hypothetical protein
MDNSARPDKNVNITSLLKVLQTLVDIFRDDPSTTLLSARISFQIIRFGSVRVVPMDYLLGFD